MSLKKPVPVDDNGRTLAGWDPVNHAPALPAILNTQLDGEVLYGNKGITLLDANGNPINSGHPLFVSPVQMSNSDGVPAANMPEQGLGIWAAGGPVLASGLPSFLSVDRMRSIEAKKATSVAITSTLANDANLTCAAGAMKLVGPGQKVQLSGGAVTEDVIVADTYTPSTSATSIPLKSPVVNTGQTTAKFDTFDAKGPNGNAMLPDGIVVITNAHEDVSSKGNFYNMQSGGFDGQSAANYPEFVAGVANGSGIDRLHSNMDNITLINAAGVTTTQTSADQTNYNARGVKIFFNMATVGTGSVTITIQGKDPVSGQYYTILAGVAVTTSVFTVYSVYPGLTAAANSVANDILPRTWRVLATANNANATTYTLAYSLIL